MYPIDFLWRAAQRHPCRTAIVSPDGNLTFEALAAEVLRRAATLARLDPLPRSRVGIGAANSVDHLLSLLAVLAAGKVWVPLNPRNGDPELRRIVEFVAPSLVLADDAMLERLAGVPAPLRPLGDLARGDGDTSAVAFGPYARGGVSVFVPQAGGTRRRLATFSAGMVFGEMAVIDRAARSAMIIADTEVECDVLSLENFDRLGVSHPATKIKLLNNLNLSLCHRLRKANRELSLFD